MILKNLLYSFLFLTVPIYVISESIFLKNLKEKLEIKPDEERKNRDNEEFDVFHVNHLANDVFHQVKGKIKFVYIYYN